MKALVFFTYSLIPYITFAQSAYMHEIAEDTDCNNNPVYGLLGVVLFFLIGYIIIHINDLITKQKEINQKEIRRKNWEEEKAKLEIEIRTKDKEQKIKEIQQRLKVHELWEINNDCIDLGLSVNWASINLGGNAISDYGYIYAWGKTTETPEFSFSRGLELSQTECKNISGNKLYDPATKWIDKNWRIPTKDEFACNAGKVTEYEVKEHIDTIMVGFRGFSKEVSIVKWNDKNPVFDIRAWRVSDRDGLQYPLRGITFSKEEFIKLREILNSIDVNCIDEYM